MRNLLLFLMALFLKRSEKDPLPDMIVFFTAASCDAAPGGHQHDRHRKYSSLSCEFPARGIGLTGYCPFSDSRQEISDIPWPLKRNFPAFRNCGLSADEVQIIFNTVPGGTGIGSGFQHLQQFLQFFWLQLE